MKYPLKDELDRTRILSILSSLDIEKRKEVEIRDYHKNRSAEQNKKWHSMIRDLAKTMGYTPVEMKTIVKYALGYYHEIEGKSRTIMVFDETHKMSVSELTGLIDQTYQWAAEKGVLLE